MLNEWKLEPARPDDTSELVPLINSAYRGESAKKGWTHEAELIEGTSRTDEASLQTLLSDPRSVLLKAVHQNGAVRGCVYLEKQGSQLYLGMLTVAPEAQGQGIGKLLLKGAEAHARRQACSAIVMTVISVRHELLDWYERHGFRPTGRREPFPEDGRFGRPLQPLEFVYLKKEL